MQIKDVSVVDGIGVQVVVALFSKEFQPDDEHTYTDGGIPPISNRVKAMAKRLKKEIPELTKEHGLVTVQMRRFETQFSFKTHFEEDL